MYIHNYILLNYRLKLLYYDFHRDVYSHYNTEDPGHWIYLNTALINIIYSYVLGYSEKIIRNLNLQNRVANGLHYKQVDMHPSSSKRRHLCVKLIHNSITRSKMVIKLALRNT